MLIECFSVIEMEYLQFKYVKIDTVSTSRYNLKLFLQTKINRYIYMKRSRIIENIYSISFWPIEIESIYIFDIKDDRNLI